MRAAPSHQAFNFDLRQKDLGSEPSNIGGSEVFVMRFCADCKPPHPARGHHRCNIIAHDLTL